MKNPYFRVALFSLLLVGTIALGGGIKSWSSGDTVSISDINSNFQHIHNQMVGGHGARLVNADVSTTANIEYTKVQNGRGIARAWADIESSCTSNPCTVAESLNVTSVGWTSTGIYTVNLSYTATDNVYAVIVSSSTSGVTCTGVSTSTTVVGIECLDLDSPAVTNAAFSVIIYDAD